MDRNTASSLSKKQLQMHLEKLLAGERDHPDLVEELEVLAQASQHFHALSHIWAPALYRKNAAVFRPFLEQYLWAWQLELDKCPGFLDELERNQEVELFRKVYTAKTNQTAWQKREKVWKKDLLAAIDRAASSAERRNVLRMYDMWWQVPDELARALYDVDAAATIDFLLEKLDKLQEWDDPPAYGELIDHMREAEDERFWELYGRCVTQKVWSKDVARLCDEIRDPEVLDDALEEHHPTQYAVPEPADTFRRMVEARGEAVMPYLMRHVDEFGAGRGWDELARAVYERQWWPLWTKIVRLHMKPEQFNALVETLVERGAGRRVMDLSGAAWINWRGTQPHHLSEEAALSLYRAHPAIARGPLREHFLPRYDYTIRGIRTYEAVARAALDAGDEAFVDFLAGRLSFAGQVWYQQDKLEGFEWYLDHYASLQARPAEFARRVTRALGSCETLDAFDAPRVRSYNPLHKLFFKEPAVFLEAPENVRDLVEASALQVRQLGLRALANDDPRARKLAADCVGHLLAAPLEDHPREVHTTVFATLVRLAVDEPALGGVIVNRLREAADLREPPFARERLVQALGSLLRRMPELRRPAEQPVIYGSEPEPNRTSVW